MSGELAVTKRVVNGRVVLECWRDGRLESSEDCGAVGPMRADASLPTLTPEPAPAVRPTFAGPAVEPLADMAIRRVEVAGGVELQYWTDGRLDSREFVPDRADDEREPEPVPMPFAGGLKCWHRLMLFFCNIGGIR